MSFVNFAKREINFKIVYYGPGLSGKTTNLQYIFNKTEPSRRGKLISLETDRERTLFFDFAAPSLGELPGGYQVRLNLCTVPGPVFYDSSRQLVLKDADGIIFVADSNLARMESNIDTMDGLISNLELQNKKLAEMPMVLQYNKRDLPNAAPIEELDEILCLPHWCCGRFVAVAPKGIGVFETLKSIANRVVANQIVALLEDEQRR